MKYAPIIIPTLCRFEHFKRLIESLKLNSCAKYTDVYVGIDYPPIQRYRQGWEKICDYVDNGNFDEFASFNVIKHQRNMGAGGNASALYKLILGRYDSYIYSEDDNVFAPNFLEYMNRCLDAFENDPDVVMVSGYSYPIQWDVSAGATCLKQNVSASMWGTGFWINKQIQINQYLQSGKMLDDLDAVVKEKKYKRMIDASLREYVLAAVSPWRGGHRFLMNMSDIGMRAYLAVADKYAISPVISKVRNMGFDGSGLYCQTINTDLNGTTAGTYNYSQQSIDESTMFEVVQNAKDSMDENRDRLNRFDRRTPAQMRRTRLYLWLMTHIGVWAGKWCAVILFPFDFGMRAFRKVWRMLNK